ncbi:hypothetical protein WCP94_002717 [Bilophila wadsworthia]
MHKSRFLYINLDPLSIGAFALNKKSRLFEKRSREIRWSERILKNVILCNYMLIVLSQSWLKA